MNNTDDNDLKIVAATPVLEFPDIKEDMKNNYIPNVSEKEHTLDKPELREKLNLTKVLEFFKNEYGITISYETLDKKLIVTDMATYKSDPSNTGLSHFTNLTGNIVLAIDESDDEGTSEGKLAHELVHFFSKREYYYSAIPTAVEGRADVDMVSGDIGFIQNGPFVKKIPDDVNEREVTLGQYLEEGLAFYVTTSFLQANGYKNKFESSFSGAFNSYRQLILTINQLAESSNYADREQLRSLLQEGNIDPKEKNWFVKLLFKAKQDNATEQLLRRIINLCCEPFSDFYDILMLLGEGYRSKGRDEWESFEDLENLLRFISSKAEGRNPLDNPNSIRNWDNLKKIEVDKIPEQEKDDYKSLQKK